MQESYTRRLIKGTLASMSTSETLTRNTVSSNNLLLKNAPKTTGIVHIGLGNFHRAHLAVYTAIAMEKTGGDWGICAYSMRNSKLVADMKAQDNLYSVLEIGPDTESAFIPGVHTRCLVGIEDLEELLTLIAEPATKIVSLTITEAGYYISQLSNGLNFSHPDIQNDLAGKSPKTIYGIVCTALAKRVRNGAGPITIMSCDNISENGTKCRQLFMDFLSQQEGKNELLEFFSESVSFPNSMVDRIVPGTESIHIDLALSRLHLTDSIPVPAEKFSMWAIEDNFAAGRPTWEEAGAIFTSEIEKFEVMKLRLLNGAHSLLAYLGALSSCETIPSSRFTPLIERALRKALYEEYLPSLEMPSGINADSYIDQLFARWSNTKLGDKTSRVGSDGSTKLPQRISVPALRALALGKDPKMMALTVAAWLQCISPMQGFEPGEYAREMKDPAREKIALLASNSSDVGSFVDKFFKESEIFSAELANSAHFVNLTARYAQVIFEQGISAAIQEALG